MNPFKKNGYMLPKASINSLYVDNDTAYELFRPELLIQVLSDNRENLGISYSSKDEDLLNEFYNALTSDLDDVKSAAKNIAIEFGYRLAKVLKTLFKPTELSINNRTNWTNDDWDFWRTIENIYIVGGMTSPLLSKIFYECVEEIFVEEDITDVSVILIEDSGHLGTKGLSLKSNNGESLLFDFGQTNIKIRHVIKNGDIIVLDTELDTVKSDFLFYKFKDDKELKQIAKLLHNYIVSTIYKAVKQVEFEGNEILVGIANYIYKGKINKNRGGYGKLALLGDNYEQILSKALSIVLSRKIKVKLHHDTSCMAYNFVGEKNTAVISLGTAFGVAFTNEK